MQTTATWAAVQQVGNEFPSKNSIKLIQKTAIFCFQSALNIPMCGSSPSSSSSEKLFLHLGKIQTSSGTAGIFIEESAIQSYPKLRLSPNV